MCYFGTLCQCLLLKWAIALQVGIKNRFVHMSGDPELIAAAILLPKFRTMWTKDESTIKTGWDSEKISVYFESVHTTNLSVVTNK